MRACLLVLLALACSSASAQFDANSSLQGDSLRTWRGASARDQLATMTNIVVKILNLNDPIDARNKAIAVQACVNQVAGDFMTGERRVIDVAMSCILKLGYLH
jgi:hypothetical protein